MSELINFSSSTSEILKQNPTEWLNDFQGLSFMGISKEKQEEFSRLIGLLKSKHEKYNKLKLAASPSVNTQIIVNDLKKLYSLKTKSQECSPSGSVLFGLSEVCVDNGLVSSGKLSCEDEIPCLSKSGSKTLLKGNLSSDDLPLKCLLMKFKILTTMLCLHKENHATINCFRINRELSEKLASILLLKQKTMFNAFEVYHKAVASSINEAVLLRYTVLKDYYSEEGVVKASQKLKDILATEIENSEMKVAALQEKVVAFEKLKGTKYDTILKDYRLVCQSIHDKLWTLENMKESKNEK